MPRPKNPTPSYLYHKKSGQARIRLKNGSRYRDIYLGKYGSPESLKKYHQILVEQFDGDNNASPSAMPTVDEAEWSIATLAVKYDEFATTHYVKDGEPTDDRYRTVIDPIVRLFGDIPVKEFGPKKFKSLREFIINRGIVRTAEFDQNGNLVKPGNALGRE